MMALPPGFDAALYMSDFFKVALPFVTIAVLFVAVRLIMKGLKR